MRRRRLTSVLAAPSHLRAGGAIATWLDNTAVPGLTEDGVPTHDIDSQWLNRTWRPG